MKRETVLITGGAGYVGSHAALELAPQYEVLVYDNLSRGHRELVPAGAELIEGDVRDTPRLADVLGARRVQAVLHFAGYAYVGESMEAPGIYFDNNVNGTLSVLEAMRHARVRQVIFSSSCTVYGLPQSTYLSENHPLAPISPYGQSKLMAEGLLPWYEQVHEIRSCVLRYFNAAGCDLQGRSGELHDPEPHVIPRLLEAASGGRHHFSILGDQHATPDGTCIRDYVHVTDLAAAHRLGLEWLEAGRPSQTFNLGSGCGISVRELVKAAVEATGRDIRVHIEPARRGDPASLIADTEHARRLLRWQPQQSGIATILTSAWRWMQDAHGLRARAAAGAGE